MDELVPFVVYAYSIGYHVTSSFATFILMFNRLLVMPYDLMLKSPV